MEYLLLVLCSMILLGVIQCMLIKKVEIARIIVFSAAGYFAMYTIVSGIFHMMGQFTIMRASIVVLLIHLVICIVLYLKKGIKNIGIEMAIKDSWVSYLAILFVCIFATGHFEFFGMGQDQGVYQTEAINLFYNSTNWENSISEYDELAEGEYKDFYRDEVWDLGGYDIKLRSKEVPGCTVDDATSESLGMWHGIPTFASILALSAKMFGIDHMMYIQMLFFICFLFVIEFILADMKIGVYLRTLMLLLVGVSPQVIWVKKSSLTEMFLALLIAVYLYFILDKNNERKALAVIPVTVFCFFHVTIYVMMPIFVLNFWYLFLTTGNRKYLKCTGGIISVFAVGFFMMWGVQPQYTISNYHHGLFILPLKIIPFFVVAACVVAGLVTAILAKKVVKTVDTDKLLKRVFQYGSIIAVLFVVFYAAINHYTGDQVKMITLISYCILTGIFLLPSIASVFIFKRFTFDHTVGILGLMFIWCILIYSVFMVKDIRHYYYYGRYLVPYLSVVILLFAYLFKDKNRDMGYILPLVGFLILLPFANVLRENQDDSKIEWSVFSDVIETAESAQVVLLDSDLMRLFYFPLRSSTGAKVYPVKDDLETTIAQVPQEGDHYLYITNESVEEENLWLRTLYRNRTYFQEDDLNNTSEWLGLVTDISYKGEYGIAVYRVETGTKNIVAGSDQVKFQGWADKDAYGFRWTNAKEAFVSCYLNENDYTMTIYNGHEIPFDQISAKEINVKVYLNENYIQTISYTADNSGMVQDVKLPSEWILKGINTIKFECDTWSPSEYGSADNSNYGFSISSIEFTEQQ